MAVIAFIRSGQSPTPVIEYAIWAAKEMGEPIRFVALSPADDPDPVLVFDAYQGMDAREDMLRELVAAERRTIPVPDDEPWGVPIVQAAARTARSRGIGKVQTDVSTERFHAYIEMSTDSTDLLVTGGREAGFDLSQTLKVRNRVFLLVPSVFAPVESWLMAYGGDAGSGRAVEFLSGTTLLKGTSGTGVIVTGDEQVRLHFRDALQHLQSAGYDLQTYELQGNPDDVLTAILTVKPVDLLVVGVSSSERLRLLFERGSTVRVISSFRGPVLLARS